MKVLSAYRMKNETRRRLIGLGACLVLYAGLTAGVFRGMRRVGGESGGVQVVVGSTPPTRNVAMKDGLFYVDGAPFVIKGVGWDPVRPGELPWTRVFTLAEVDADFARIKAAGFNTVRTWAAMRAEELALAEKYHLRVLQGIWVPPDGAFDDPTFRRRTLAAVASAVEATRWSPAVIGYLVLNEPRAQAVARAGIDASLSFLREVVSTVRALDPSAPIGYASWPGMEALDDALLDFVAFNLYPHRPRVVMDELGLLSYANLIRRSIARNRPFLVSEFGLSVSPGRPVKTPGRGGASEAEQAQQLVEMAATFAAARAAGTVVFQWSDGWWKNNEVSGDEATHDPLDPEEWFGLVQYKDLADRQGTPRPALGALTTYQRAVLVEPAAGFVSSPVVPVRIFTSEPVRLYVRIDASPPAVVSLTAEGESWLTGQLLLETGTKTRHTVDFELADANGKVIRSERRILNVVAQGAPELLITPARSTVLPRGRFKLEIKTRPGMSFIVAVFTEDHYNEQRLSVVAGSDGRAKVEFQAPEDETILTAIAFEHTPNVPLAERSAGFGMVEVRKPR